MSDVISLVQMSECKQYIVCADRKSHVVIWKNGQVIKWNSMHLVTFEELGILKRAMANSMAMSKSRFEPRKWHFLVFG
jgi:hypothetical protein